MRKHIAAALAAILAVSTFAFPSVAYASGTATMDVSLTLTEDDVTPPDADLPDNPPEYDPEPSGPDFIINIPASITLNEQREVLLTWENYGLLGYDTVLVYIDAAKTFIGEAFYLTTGDDSTEAQRISCYITCSAPGYEGSLINGTNDRIVAEFVANHSPEMPISLGLLKFETPDSYFNKEPGTYTGTVYFKIEVNS